MDKIKKFLREALAELKKHPYASITAGILFLLLILFLPVLRFNWLSYPASLRTRIALQRLLSSIESDVYCREDCSLKRHLYESVISDSLRKKSLGSRELMERYILDPDLSTETRKYLLKIFNTSGMEASDAIKEFVPNPGNDLNVRIQIAKAWPGYYPDSLNKEILKAYDKAKTFEDKLSILRMLEGEESQESVSLVWQVLSSEREPDLIRQALLFLSNMQNKKLVYAAEDLYKLKTFLEKADNSARLKDQAILLLNEYYDYFPDESTSLLIEVINGDDYDNYHKAFASNILNKHRAIQLPLPLLTDEDWDSYYNN